MYITPQLWGYFPVANDALLGVHRGEVQLALSKNTPFLIIRSIWGVLIPPPICVIESVRN